MSISSVNAIIFLTVPGVFPVPTQLDGFAADDIFDVDEVDFAESMMGADGILTAGLVNAKTPWNITLMADSISVPLFEAWDAIQQDAQDVFPAFGNVTLTGIGRSYTMVNGFLVRGKRMPDAKKVLMPRKWRIDWQAIIPIPIGATG